MSGLLIFCARLGTEVKGVSKDFVILWSMLSFSLSNSTYITDKLQIHLIGLKPQIMWNALYFWVFNLNVFVLIVFDC